LFKTAEPLSNKKRLPDATVFSIQKVEPTMVR
jgi:hypothetical protein